MYSFLKSDPLRRIIFSFALLSFVSAGFLSPFSFASNSENYAGLRANTAIALSDNQSGTSNIINVNLNNTNLTQPAGTNSVLQNNQNANTTQTTGLGGGNSGSNSTQKDTAPRKKVQKPEFGNSPFNCWLGWGSGWDFAGCIGVAAYNVVYIPSAYLLAAAGSVFDITMAYTLSNKVMGASFVETGWELTRDLANMLFIFILLIISISTILRIQSYNAKQLLGKLIIMALLINFSLFISRAVVDAGNMLGLFFYSGISSPVSTKFNSDGAEIDLSDMLVGGVKSDNWLGIELKTTSASLVSAFNVQKLLSGPDQLKNSTEVDVGKLVFFYLVGAAFMGVAAWVFFSVSFMFIGRVAMLWLLMAVAPLAFAAMILPSTQSWAKKWWGELFSKSFCIAVFLFLIWLVVAFTDSNIIQSAFKNPGQTSNLVEFVIIIFLQFGTLITLLFLAKSMTAKMCDQIGGASVGLASKVGGVMAGGAGVVGGKLGRVAGIGAGITANSSWLKNKAANVGKDGKSLGKGRNIRTMAWKGLGKAAKTAASSSFDIRNTRLGKMGDSKWAGQGSSASYEKTLAEKTKRDEAYGDWIASESPGDKEGAGDARLQAFAERKQNPHATLPFLGDTAIHPWLVARHNKESGAAMLKQAKDKISAREKGKAKEGKIDESISKLRNTISNLGEQISRTEAVIGSPKDKLSPKETLDLQNKVSDLKNKQVEAEIKVTSLEIEKELRAEKKSTDSQDKDKEKDKTTKKEDSTTT